MKILLIARSFAPDSNIASKRLSYFAKYLNEFGHDVYVIRSGLVFTKPDAELGKNTRSCFIYSYEGNNSAAERYERGENVLGEKSNIKSHSIKLPAMLRKGLKTLYHNVWDPFRFYVHDGRRIKDKIISLYLESPDMRGFDIVLSTFSPLGCIQAGRIISQKERCAWIVDLRDLMDNNTFPWLLRFINSFTQRIYLRDADCCLCVSKGNTARLSSICRGKYKKKVYCVPNGFINQNNIEKRTTVSEKIRICYTGSVYGGGRFNAKPLFRALRNAKIQESDVKIVYAGNDCTILIQQAKSFGYAESVTNYHYLSRTKTAQLQASSDLFLVISWNTRRDQGILTGKFYEALQHRKPIVALVSGDVPNSELKQLIEKYRLGICCEEIGGIDSEIALSAYLRKQFERKQAGKSVEYNPDEFVFSRFEYSAIVRELEKIMMEIKKNK